MYLTSQQKKNFVTLLNFTDRCLREVVCLEDEVHTVAHLNDLSAHQTKLLVIIENSIH